MSGLFIWGLVFLGILGILTWFLWYDNKTSMFPIIESTFIKVLYGVSVLVTLFCLIYGLFNYSSRLAKQYPDEDGKTMTVIEYNMVGWSRTKHNIKTPTTTKGCVTSIEFKSRYVRNGKHGGHRRRYTNVEIILIDGRKTSDRLSGHRKDIQEGTLVYYKETFYPNYRTKISYKAK